MKLRVTHLTSIAGHIGSGTLFFKSRGSRNFGTSSSRYFLNLRNGGGNMRGMRLLGGSKSPVRAFRFK